MDHYCRRHGLLVDMGVEGFCPRCQGAWAMRQAIKLEREGKLMHSAQMYDALGKAVAWNVALIVLVSLGTGILIGHFW